MIVALKSSLIDIYSYFLNYCANSKFLLLFIICLMYLFFEGKEIRIKVVYPSLLIWGIVINPVIYRYIFSTLFKETYWRFMWMLPVVPVTLVAFISVIRRIKKLGVRVAVTVGLGGIVLLLGANIYTERKQFSKAENMYKLPQNSINLVDAVLEIVDKPVCMVPRDVYSYSRQYKTDFLQVYGRNIEGYIYDYNFYENANYNHILQSVQRGNRLASRVMAGQAEQCNVVIDSENNVEMEKIVYEYGYELADKVGGKNIYFCSQMPKLKWHMVQWGYNDLANRMGYTLTSDDGDLVLIDGGYQSWDHWMFDDYIAQNNNYVDSWIFTNIDYGHIGIFLDYVKNGNIKIGTLYVPNINREQFCNAEGEAEVYDAFMDAVSKFSNVIRVETGKEYDINGLKIKVIVDGYEENTEIQTDATMIFAIEGESKNILFCSDADSTYEAIIREYTSSHKIDVLEMSLHENKSLSMDFFYTIHPLIVFLDCGSERIEKYKETNQLVIDKIMEESEVFWYENFGWLYFD